MFKQRRKDKKRATSCTTLKHIFGGNKTKCLCKNYYKVNGKLYRTHGKGRALGGNPRVVGNSADFHYKMKTPTKKMAKRRLKRIIRKQKQVALGR